jgi:hypothetical protein
MARKDKFKLNSKPIIAAWGDAGQMYGNKGKVDNLNVMIVDPIKSGFMTDWNIPSKDDPNYKKYIQQIKIVYPNYKEGDDLKNIQKLNLNRFYNKYKTKLLMREDGSMEALPNLKWSEFRDMLKDAKLMGIVLNKAFYGDKYGKATGGKFKYSFKTKPVTTPKEKPTGTLPPPEKDDPERKAKSDFDREDVDPTDVAGLPPNLRELYIQMSAGKDPGAKIEGKKTRSAGANIVGSLLDGLFTGASNQVAKRITGKAGQNEFEGTILPAAEKAYGEKFSYKDPKTGELKFGSAYSDINWKANVKHDMEMFNQKMKQMEKQGNLTNDMKLKFMKEVTELKSNIAKNNKTGAVQNVAAVDNLLSGLIQQTIMQP